MSKLAWGILGTGNIAKQFVAGIVGSHRCTLAAVGSRTAESAQAFAGLYPCPHVHASYEALLADPSVEAIYISVPNSMHYEWTIKALKAGKHVLCEKPFATNLAQAEEMLDTATKKGLVITEAFMYRSHPQTHAIQKAMADGLIGPLKVIRASFLYAAAKVQGSIKFNRELAGGALMDIGCYCLSFARLFAGAEPSALTASSHLHPGGVDDYTAGTLTFPNGILCSFACGMTVRADNTTSLLGSDGFIDVPVPWKPPVTDATFYHTDSTGQRHAHVVSANKPLYGLEADDFAPAVLDGTAPRLSRQEILGNQRCLDVLRGQIGLPY